MQRQNYLITKRITNSYPCPILKAFDGLETFTSVRVQISRSIQQRLAQPISQHVTVIKQTALQRLGCDFSKCLSVLLPRFPSDPTKLDFLVAICPDVGRILFQQVPWLPKISNQQIMTFMTICVPCPEIFFRLPSNVDVPSALTSSIITITEVSPDHKPKPIFWRFFLPIRYDYLTTL